MKGVFSTPVCARKQTNGPPSTDQGISTASYNSRHALSPSDNIRTIIEKMESAYVQKFHVQLAVPCLPVSFQSFLPTNEKLLVPTLPAAF